MASDLFYLPGRSAINLDGFVASGAVLSFFATGTSNPQNVFSDSGLTQSLGATVTANAAGKFPSIYLDSSKVYRVRCVLSGVVLFDDDPYYPGSASEATTELLAASTAAIAAADRAEAAAGDAGYYPTIAAGAAAVSSPNTFISDEDGYLGRYDDAGNFLDIAGPVFRGNSGKTYGMIAAVIRAPTTGAWEVIDDASHTPTPSDLALTVNSNGTLTVSYPGADGSVVGTFLTANDETLATQPLFSGASVGTGSAVITFACPLEIYFSGTAAPVGGYSYLGTPAALASASDPLPANTTWAYHLDISGGKLTIKHVSQSYTTSFVGAALVDLTASNSVDQVRLINSTKTLKEIQAYNYIAGTTAATSTPAVTTEIVGCSASWDSGTGRLTITHPAVSELNNATAEVSAVTTHRARVASTTTTTIVVEFYDYATNTLYTGANAIACRFNRTALAPTAWTGSCRGVLTSAPITVRAQDISTGGGGNIWLMGTMIQQAD